MKKSVTLEEAFGIVIELFKAEQRRRENAEQLIEWFAAHVATADEYRNMAKKFVIARKESKK